MADIKSVLSTVISDKRRISALKSLGIVTIEDALTYFPYKLHAPYTVRPLSQIREGEKTAFAATIRETQSIPMSGRRGWRIVAQVDDADFCSAGFNAETAGFARLTFFSYKKYYVQWMERRLAAGLRIVVAGQASFYNGSLEFAHPQVFISAENSETALSSKAAKPDIISVEKGLKDLGSPRPAYHANSRISSKRIRETILALLETIGTDEAAETAEPALKARIDIQDVIPPEIAEKYNLMSRSEAFAAIHSPKSPQEYDRARKTFKFEEALVLQTAMLKSRNEAEKTAAFDCKETDLAEKCVKSLPFELTTGQKKCIEDISRDMADDKPMQKLVQGDVGAGKTIVAICAMLQAAASGQQAVLIAPTRVLAQQHYQTISRTVAGCYAQAEPADDSCGIKSSKGDDLTKFDDLMLETAEKAVKNGQIPILFLHGGMKLSGRRRVAAMIASSQPCIIVATHAAFSKSFQSTSLGLVVIDEQHRFGVEQRDSLRRRFERVPHMLIMTATPIPRTEARIWFADLDSAELRELPEGRKPVETYAVCEQDSGRMAALFSGIRKRIDAGERIYVVCPRIDDKSENEDNGENAVYNNPGTFNNSGTYDNTENLGKSDSLRDSHAENIDYESGEKPAQMHSVYEIAQRLSCLPQFEGVDIAVITGRDSDEDKTRIMDDFISGRKPILVSTTVIEVGVDVENASVIVIFDADRFGLSQLHQLRGRVGRTGRQAWAFPVTRVSPEEKGYQKLEIIRQSHDGFAIAEQDLQLRGAGDMLGQVQSGLKTSLKILKIAKSDVEIIEKAREEAENLLASDPRLSGQNALAGAVLDLSRETEFADAG